MAVHSPRVDWNQFHMLTRAMVGDIQRDGWQPDIVVGLQSGGYFVAVTLAKLLGVTCIPGLDVTKDADGVRSLSGAARLNRDYVRGKQVLGVDDTVISGTLTRLLRQEVEGMGGHFRMAALVGVDDFPKAEVQYVGSHTIPTPAMPWAWLMRA